MALWLKIVIWSGIGLVLLAIAIVFSRWFVSTTAGQGFVARYPGHVPLPEWAPVGLPGWLGWQHFLNVFFMVMLVRAGLIVRSGVRPAGTWIRKKPKPASKKIAIEVWTHLSIDLLWITNGAVFMILIFATGQWVKIVPTSWEVFPNAISTGLQYLSLQWPEENGWTGYNSLQLLGYFVTAFIAAPLSAITGFRQSPLWPNRFKRLSAVYTSERAKAIHFPVMVYFVCFVIVHVGLVFATGPIRNLNHMFASQDTTNWWGVGVFAVAFVFLVTGWFLVRPAVMKQIGSKFGKIGR